MTNGGSQGKIAIIGLGLIGSSLGFALKGGGLGNVRVHGFDSDGHNGRTAEKAGAVDVNERSVEAAVSGASLVVIAVPILAVRSVMEEIAPHLAEGAVVTDTASTKADVMRWAAETLPASVDFVGGHPMAGKEVSGPEAADPGLFAGKPYCITPSLHASPGAIKTVAGVASVVGAEPLFMDAAEHDQYAAAVSHMPLMLSTALFTLLRNSASWEDLAVVAGPGFRDMTRLASGDPAMAAGIWQTNREALIHWLERIGGELGRYREMLKDARDADLLRVFTEAQLERDAFLSEPPRRVMPNSGVQVDKGKALMDMLIGARMADNLRRAMPEEDKGKARKPKEDEPRISIADRIAEGVKRDLDKLEAKDAAKASEPGQAPPDA